MADDILLQGKTYPQRVNDQGEAFVTSSGGSAVTNYDVVSSVLSYVGKTSAGSLGSTASWQVKRLVFGSGGDVTTTFADGDSNFDNVWDDRASLTYS